MVFVHECPKKYGSPWLPEWRARGPTCTPSTALVCVWSVRTDRFVCMLTSVIWGWGARAPKFDNVQSLLSERAGGRSRREGRGGRSFFLPHPVEAGIGFPDKILCTVSCWNFYCLIAQCPRSRAGFFSFHFSASFRRFVSTSLPHLCFR